jgi:2-oxo-hept-3-ene-1,7-dioate hydratase
LTEPDASEAVARGMRALLARRDVDLGAGAQSVGWKIGFNTPAIQEHFGLAQPVVGYLTDAGLTADGATVPLAGWAAPAVEVEVAIRVGPDLGVAGLAPALELVDLGMPFHDIEMVLADNICQRGVVFGAEVPGVDPWAVVATVTSAANEGGATDDVGDTVFAEGRLSEDPAATTEFVRSYLASHGAQLAEGDRIIAGSLVAPVSVAPGDALQVHFGPLGRLRIAFS